MAKATKRKDDNRYLALIEKIFFDRYRAGVREIDFEEMRWRRLRYL
jgi:hypothetical protein